ncbi:LOW QUALITY PROTEIN: hypothetical protein TorRG33x02_073140 [Trema orientale]|uniref:LRR domain containing protein n=1 Tax=Trema orientale TaxID=63057 RepID=A0A2P5FGK9_TREOI|nr:LOW QUALITY PROTEIN: hypothetical protein TorRG33x02_073140 [Trema orientale]
MTMKNFSYICIIMLTILLHLSDTILLDDLITLEEIDLYKSGLQNLGH